MAFPACGWEAPEVEDPDGAVRRIASSPTTWKKDLALQLDALNQEGLSTSQVMILAPHRPQTLGLREAELIGPWPVNIASDWWDVTEAGQVNFGTVHGFKGLESDVVIYLAPGYRHPDAERLAYTAYSRARHRLVVLEKAIAQPVRTKPIADAAKVQVPKPAARPSFQQAPAYSDEQRASLMSALTAAKTYKPKQTR
jgi:hypothetical protein